MKYEIVLANSAEKELFALQKSDISKIVKSIDSLQSNPRPKGFKKLKGSGGFLRVRCGNFRIIYTIDDTNWMISVLIIRNRKDVYK